MRLTRHRLIIGAIIIAAVVFFFRGNGQRYIGGISAGSPKGAGGADSVSAMPRGYRSEPPNSPYARA